MSEIAVERARCFRASAVEAHWTISFVLAVSEEGGDSVSSTMARATISAKGDDIGYLVCGWNDQESEEMFLGTDGHGEGYGVKACGFVYTYSAGVLLSYTPMHKYFFLRSAQQRSYFSTCSGIKVL